MSDTPSILRIIQAQRAALLRGDVATLRRYATQWQSVEDALKDAAELLAYDIADRKARGLPVSQSKLYQLQRYQDLMRQTQQQVQNYARQIAPQIEYEQQRLWGQGQIDASEQIASITSSFNRLPVQATNTMIGTTADGSPLINTLRASWPDAVDAMTRELVRGVALGVNPRIVARKMATASQASLKRMLTVARTEQLRAYRESSRELYQRSGVVQRYKRLAAKNARTCVLCLADDAHVYEVQEPMPIHVCCRCTSVPLVEGYTINTGKTGSEWFASQSADVQRKMLGPSRYEMYKNGTPLSAFSGVRNHPDWGPTLRANTITTIKPIAQRCGLGARARDALNQVAPQYRRDVDNLQNRYNALIKKSDKLFSEYKFDEGCAVGDEAGKILAQLTQMQLGENSGIRARINEIIYHQSGSKFNLNYQERGIDAVDPNDQSEWRRGVDAFRRLIGNRLNGANINLVGHSYYERAYANIDSAYVFRGDQSRTVVHELGHVLERLDPNVRQHAINFLERRTSGETPVSLKQYGKRYGDDEVTTPDKFSDPYIGKRYPDGSTEIMSMGLEQMYRDPIKFANDDPAYFDFIYELLHGDN